MLSIERIFSKTGIEKIEPNQFYSLNLIGVSIYIVLLIAIYFIFYKKNKNGYFGFIKNYLLGFTILGGFLTYCIGYHVYLPKLNIIAKIGLSLFSTARLFILGNDLVEVHEHVNLNFFIWFSVFSVSAALISTSVILNVVGKSLLSRLKILFKKSQINYIFIGLNEAGFTLAKDINKKNPNAFIVFIHNILPNENPAFEHKVAEINGILINSKSFLNTINLHNEEFLFQPQENHIEEAKHLSVFNIISRGLKRKIRKYPSHFFIFSEQEHTNLSLYEQIFSELKNANIQQNINIHIRTTSKSIENIYSEINSESNYKNIHVKLHNQALISASQLVKANLPIKWIKNYYPDSINRDATISRDFTILFLGFGLIGKAAFLKFYEQGQFVGSNFNAIIIDKDMEVCEGEFKHKSPGVVDSLAIKPTFYNLKINTIEFYEKVKSHTSSIDFVVVSLGNDELNMKIAHDLRSHLHKQKKEPYQIFVHISMGKQYHKYLETNSHNIKIFGRDSEVFTEDIIVKGSIEEVAKKIHDFYNQKKDSDKRIEWDKLNPFLQQSNISAAEHTITKLILAGYNYPNNLETLGKRYLKGLEIIDQLFQYNTYEEFEVALDQERKINLGKTEHLRWNAFHFSNGWTTWHLNDIPKNIHENKDEEKKIHACLVDWNELDKVTLRYKPYNIESDFDYKKSDLNCMKDIFENSKEGLFEEKQKIG